MKVTPVYNFSNTRTKNTVFGATLKDFGFLYKKSLVYHKANIYRTNTELVEKYFKNIGNFADFSKGDSFARKTIAYGAYNASEIFRQLKFNLPPYICGEDFRNLGLAEDITGLCYMIPMQLQKIIPARATFFNTFEAKKDVKINNKAFSLCWDSMFEIIEENKASNFLPTNHFLSPFIHEYAHSLHLDKLYSKFGAPFIDKNYRYNPGSVTLIEHLKKPLSCLTTPIEKIICEDVSQYGTTNLSESFAEAITKDILNNVDLFSLRLTNNPFSKPHEKPIVAQVLYETFEGLIADGQGLI